LTTGKEFAKYHGKKAKKLDRKIAKEAGLKDMGWMGSKSYIDSKVCGVCGMCGMCERG
jgi:hypothetical protein